MPTDFTTSQIDRSWRGLTDEELRHYLTSYKRRLVLLDEEVLDPEIRASTRQYLAMLIKDAEYEDGLRERAAALGVPRDHPRFPPEWLLDLKARIPLDDLCEWVLGASLGRLVSGTRRGACPLCEHGQDCFVVYLASPDEQHYVCYRCGARGDAINAIRQKLKIGFVEAIEFLARHGGVPLPVERRPSTPKPAARRSNRVVVAPRQGA